ncbi:MAG: 5-formyltetrahydrofolate cyclo-ligase [bacterium]
MDIRLAKKMLRKEVLQKRDSLSKEEWNRKSDQIQKKLQSLEEVSSAKNIFIFINFRSEVDTRPIIEFLLSKNKNVIVPYTDIENKRLRLFYLNNFSELKSGSFGILEPDPKIAKEAALEDVDLVIMPGSVFDLKGGRIGYGGGFYDRLLPSLRPDVKTIAIAFELQIVDEVPMGYYDRRVNLIVTEDRIIRL